jgi:hypothetical protein
MSANVPPNQPQSAYDMQAAQARGMQSMQGVSSPMSNLAYDVITALQSKLEGLNAYDKYCRDGNVQLWQQIAQLDQQAVMMLTQALEQLAQAGELRPSRTGQQPQQPSAAPRA